MGKLAKVVVAEEEVFSCRTNHSSAIPDEGIKVGPGGEDAQTKPCSSSG